MNFKGLIVRYAVCVPVSLLTLTGCNWDDKYANTPCDGVPDATVVDCRTSSNAPQLPPSRGVGNGVDDSVDGTVTRYPRDVNTLRALQPVGTVSWSPNHADEIGMFLVADGDVLYSGSKFHNYLRSFRVSADGDIQALQGAPLLSVAGERYGVDGVTGATEQVLSGLSIDTSNSGGNGAGIAYAQVNKYNTKSQSVGVGLYVLPYAAPQSLPSLGFSKGDAGNFIPYGSLRTSALSNDKQTLALAGGDREIRKYSVNDISQPALRKKLGQKSSAMTFSQEGSRLYVGGLTIVGKLQALASQSLDTLWEVDLPDKPLALHSVADKGVLVTLASGNTVVWINNNGDWATSIPIEFPEQLVATALNRSGDKFVAVGVKGHIEVVDLITAKRAFIATSTKPIAVTFDTYDRVWVMSDNGLQGYAGNSLK